MKKEAISPGVGWQKEEWIIGISAAILIISAFLTWIKSSLSLEELGYQGAIQSINGISAQAGYATVLFGLVIIVMLFTKRTPKITAIVLGALSALIGLAYLSYTNKIASAIAELSGEVGIGVYLTIFAGVGLIIGGILKIRKS